ncbi:hypothetical protein [Vibrio tarriae]|uniref:hypothetical protein n=1 Tax=Vibrio tarriae TaxID=2014742 RepID=UPI00215BE344|nr:hypothetical protein [Vibrio tarriae]
MFTVNHQTNRISPVRTKKFSELGFSERKHLQLFTCSGLRLAHEPSSLGEELLIIQKEFNGFALIPSLLNAGRERLGLLALENKMFEVY